MLLLVGFVIAAVLIGGSQGGVNPTKPNPTPAPAPTESSLSWAEVLEQNPDPKIVTNADFLKRIAETKLPWRVKDKASGIEMLLVPPGKFMMGKSLGDTAAIDWEKPAHQVTITNAFYLGRTEVTQLQWMKVMGKNPSRFQEWSSASREDLISKSNKDGNATLEVQENLDTNLEKPGKLLTENYPVETISWDDCQKFCEKTGLKLPTEAQWEYACRAGVDKPTYGKLDQIAWFREDSGNSTHPVAEKAPNALGFYDMLGNVWEWCHDWLDVDYYRSCEDGVVDPTGPSKGKYRLLRGGGWNGYFNHCRASKRGGNSPDFIIFAGHGLRVARTP